MLLSTLRHQNIEQMNAPYLNSTEKDFLQIKQLPRTKPLVCAPHTPFGSYLLYFKSVIFTIIATRHISMKQTN